MSQPIHMKYPVPSNELDRTVQFLQDAFNAEGWPYYPSGDPSLEATVWCAIATRNIDKLKAASILCLRSMQNSDGGWSTEPGSGLSDWSTGLALMSLRILLSEKFVDDPDTARAIEFLKSHRMDAYRGLFRKTLVALIKGPEALDYPRGWGWNPNCYQWVEPTSFVLAGLKPLFPEQSDDLKSDVASAEQFLINCACHKGGWNHGDYHTLGVWMPPYPVTTAEALVALQDLAVPEVSRGLQYLQTIPAEEHTVLSLSWAIFALDCLGLNASPLIGMLIRLQNPDGSFGSNFMLSGIAASAIGIPTYGNPLKFSHSRQKVRN